MRRLSVSLVELGGGFVHLEAESLEAVDDVAHGRKTARLELGKDEFVVDENFKGARADELVGKVVREPDGAEGHHLVLGDGGVPGGRLREAEKGKDFFAAEKEDDDRELGEPGELGGDDADEGGGILLGLDRAELVRVPFFEELSQFEKVPLRTSAGAQLHENVPGPQQRALLLLRGRLLRDVLRELLVLAAVHDRLRPHLDRLLCRRRRRRRRLHRGRGRLLLRGRPQEEIPAVHDGDQDHPEPHQRGEPRRSGGLLLAHPPLTPESTV
mmetsp:Transcript_19739/g.62135  ORF Transcript_19739/g.62135 Transcript_19739/m.62135 type:complete len:270 (-) Transcript_19739:27-836(-)